MGVLRLMGHRFVVVGLFIGLIVFFICGNTWPTTKSPMSVPSVKRETNILLLQQATQVIHDYEGDMRSLQQAADKLQRVLASDPKNALVYVRLGEIEALAGYQSGKIYDAERLQKAHLWVDKALELNPGLVDAYSVKAILYLRANDLKQAKSMIAQVETLAPSSSILSLLKGNLAQRQHQYEIAIRLSKPVLETSTDSYLLKMAYHRLEECYRALNEYDLADQAYRDSLKRWPTSAWENINYSDFLNERKEYDKAMVYAKIALRIADFGMAHYQLARAYCGKGIILYWDHKDYEEAGRYFRLAIKEAPDEPKLSLAYYGLGSYYWRKGHDGNDPELLKKALSVFQKAYELNPKDTLAKQEIEKTKRDIQTLEQLH